MGYALEKEQVIAGFINTHEDGTIFTLKDIDDYITSLWNVGLRFQLNFKKSELKDYLDKCNGIRLGIVPGGYVIDKSFLSDDMTPMQAELLHNDKDLAKSVDLFCRLSERHVIFQMQWDFGFCMTRHEINMSVLYTFYRPWDMKKIDSGNYYDMPFFDDNCHIQLYPDEEKSINQCFPAIINRYDAIKLQDMMRYNKSLFTDLMDEHCTDSLIIRIT